MATSQSKVKSVHAFGSDEITIALVGCGGRGRGAALNALQNVSMPNVKLVALADAFDDPMRITHDALKSRCGDKVDIPQERRFSGLDGYKSAIDAADMCLLCTPPGFRPMQFEAAVDAGKIIFAEKPVAIDGPGIQRVAAAYEKSKEKGLYVAVGHHLRHEDKHLIPMDMIHNGAIGDLQFLRIYFNSGGVWTRPRRPEQTEMQYQVSNWYYFNWLSGDHIVEQHVHDIDVMNWMSGEDHPVEANGMGGRQVRVDTEHGEIFDHHSIEFTYASGLKGFSFCRHMPNTWGSFSEHAHGSKGVLNIEGHGSSKLTITGQEPQVWTRDHDGHQIEHDDLFAAIKAGESYNEMGHGITGTLTAILGRMATYSGKVVTWDQALNSQEDLMPESLEWDAQPKPQPGPDGMYPCAMPGTTPVF
jgi:myo-inositol 2-dehydrogenase / D-chiro-inositol 1-dehydrogenase